MKRPAAAFACSIALAACAAVSAHPLREPPSQHPQAVQRVVRPATAWMVAAFSLTDQHGRAFTQERLRDRWTFVLFGDTRCQAPCAAALAALTGLQQRIARADVSRATQVLFVSLDPRRDRAQHLRAYLATYDPRFIGVTGDPATLARLLADWQVGVAAAAPAHEAAARPAYSGALHLVGPDGAVRAQYLPPFDVPRLTADYLKTRIGAGAP